MTDTDTSAEAVDAIFNRNWPRIYDNMVQAENITRALAAERDTLRQQLAEAKNALVAIEDMGKDLKGAKMATLKIGLSFLCDTASEALKANGDDT
jgi:chaperonin cofactor prefoldin